MALTEAQIQEIEKAGESFLAARRPPVEIRSKVDLAYRIEGQSVFIYEIRPGWDNPDEIMILDFAKTTLVKTQNHWKIYWMRADLKWHSYPPKPTVKTIKKFFELVDNDEHACFLG